MPSPAATHQVQNAPPWATGNTRQRALLGGEMLDFNHTLTFSEQLQGLVDAGIGRNRPRR